MPVRPASYVHAEAYPVMWYGGWPLKRQGSQDTKGDKDEVAIETPTHAALGHISQIWIIWVESKEWVINRKAMYLSCSGFVVMLITSDFGVQHCLRLWQQVDGQSSAILRSHSHRLQFPFPVHYFSILFFNVYTCLTEVLCLCLLCTWAPHF